MKALDTLNRLKQIDLLIRLKATGNPTAFAARLGISQSMMYNYLNLLKTLGGPIRYSQRGSSYYYERPVTFELGYRQKKEEKN